MYRAYLFCITFLAVCIWVTPSVTARQCTVEFSYFRQDVAEGVGSVDVPLYASTPSPVPIEVEVILEVSSTVKSGADILYSNPWPVTIPAGSTDPVIMTIPIIDDDLPEGTESIMLAISSVGTNALTGGESEHVVFIADNDSCAPQILGLATQYCLIGAHIPLVGLPGGGLFTGPGVTNGVFIPQLAGAGTHAILYTLENAECTNAVLSTVSVLAAEDPDCSTLAALTLQRAEDTTHRISLLDQNKNEINVLKSDGVFFDPLSELPAVDLLGGVHFIRILDGENEVLLKLNLP